MIPEFSTSVAWGGAVLAQLAETLPGHQDSVLDMVVGSGPVVRAVLVILVVFSIGCWGIALAKSVEMRRARRQSRRFIEIFWDAKHLGAIQTASVALKGSPGAQGLRGRYPGGGHVQSLRAPGARAHRRDGDLRVRISQHRRTSLPEMTFDQGPSTSEAISQINVTPLVDVMLVLLIIFMVTAPILQQGVSVDLPKVAAGPLAGQEEQLVVNVGKAGQLFLNDTPLTPEM